MISATSQTSSLPLSQLPSKTELREEVRRENARRSLLDFACYIDPLYYPDPVHILIADALDKVVSGEIKRLMIFAPPQHGKSRLTSEMLPAYWFGRRPNDSVIISSYGAALADDKSKKARGIVESQEYQELFGDRPKAAAVRTKRDSRAVDHWAIEKPYRGELRAAGVDGPVTGHGALLGIIDDPFENWKTAQSPTMRLNAREWYRTTFRTRIREGGAIVLIMTRWHEHDLAGYLLKEQAGEWVVLRLPAIAETQEERDSNNRFLGLAEGLGDPLGRLAGEPLAPHRFSKEALLELQRDVGGMAWGAEYQGVPRAPEGNRFKRKWFEENIVGAAPRQAKRVRYWDKAGTKDGGAYTAGVLLAETDEFTYIEDVVRGQWSAAERERIIKDTAEADAARYNNEVKIYVEQEPGSGGKESAESTIQNLKGYPVYKDIPSGDKDVRLEPFAVQAENLNIRMVRGAWNYEYVEEFVTIPNSTYRDQSDATGAGFNMLHAKPKQEAPRQVPVSGLWRPDERKATPG